MSVPTWEGIVLDRRTCRVGRIVDNGGKKQAQRDYPGIECDNRATNLLRGRFGEVQWNCCSRG